MEHDNMLKNLENKHIGFPMKMDMGTETYGYVFVWSNGIWIRPIDANNNSKVEAKYSKFKLSSQAI